MFIRTIKHTFLYLVNFFTIKHFSTCSCTQIIAFHCTHLSLYFYFLLAIFPTDSELDTGANTYNSMATNSAAATATAATTTTVSRDKGGGHIPRAQPCRRRYNLLVGRARLRGGKAPSEVLYYTHACCGTLSADVTTFAITRKRFGMTDSRC